MIRRPKTQEWLLLAAQLPATPSSARVALWRRMRAAGAAGVIQGTWILPNTEGHRALLLRELATVRASGGAALLFAGKDITGPDDHALIGQFRADRAREYHEFAERSDGFFAEIAKETRAKKFTFAELEEIEDDLAKLKAWLDKITARDFFPDRRGDEARTTLKRCELALRAFANKVYRAEGAAQDARQGQPRVARKGGHRR
jgi:Protein ChrB, N-terminal